MFRFRASGIDRPPWRGPLLKKVAGTPDGPVDEFEGLGGWISRSFWEAEFECRMREFHYGVMVPAINDMRAIMERDRDAFIRKLLANDPPPMPRGKRAAKATGRKIDRYLRPPSIPASWGG